MLRKLIALMITVYAIAFAFGALAAVRWPSIMMVVTATLAEGAPATGFENVNWRELGIIYGAPYFLAALCFYASAVMVSSRRAGSLTWFVMGCVAGFPCAFMVDFEAGWWRDPSSGEGAVAGAGVAALMLLAAILELRRKGPGVLAEERAPAKIVSEETGQEFVVIAARDIEAKEKASKIDRRRPQRIVSPAIARQRAHFAAQGAKMAVRRQRRVVW